MRFNFYSDLASILKYIFIVCVLKKKYGEVELSFKNLCFLIPLYKTFAIKSPQIKYKYE